MSTFCKCGHDTEDHVIGLCIGLEEGDGFCQCTYFTPRTCPCPACHVKRQHTLTDWFNHPMAGHGFTKEWGWTHPQAKAEHDAEANKAASK